MISVVVIGKNEGMRLAYCLECVHQSLRHLSYELIYVDSRSTDGSLTLAKEHGAACYLLDEEATTAGLGRLVGTQIAKGEYLLFLDGDMLLQPGFVQQAMMVMASGNYDGACGIREDRYMKNGKVVSVCENYFGCTQLRIAPEFGGALFIKAEALARSGGWSGNTIACEEAELHARLLAHGCRIVELPILMFIHCDNVRDERGLLGAVFSRRRLGEGQAMVCAIKNGSAQAYIHREREKFSFYLLDWLCVLLILLLGGAGFACGCFLQTLQFGFFMAKRRPRAFVSQKLFFFALPLGMLTWRSRKQSFKACV